MASSITKLNTSISTTTLLLSGVLILLVLTFCAECTYADSSNSDIPALVNSTVACTRGDEKTVHYLDCDNGDGTAGLLAVERLFYGATPTSSGCSFSAPYDKCCKQDPENNCVFDSDFKLDETAVKCSGKTKCRFYGQPVNSIRGNCDSAEFPAITSFSFIEYSCLNTNNLFNICPKEENTTSGLKLFLDSNHEHDNEHLSSEDDCKCVLYTRCGANVTLNAVILQLRRINSTDCVEEMTLRDMKDPSTMSKYSCLDHKSNLAITSKSLMTSISNTMSLQLHLFEKHNGKVLITATSSDPNSAVGIRCGPQISAESLPEEYLCQDDDAPPVFIEDPSDNDVDDNDDDVQDGNTDQNKGERTVIKETTEELHGGAIAGIVLAVVGILLVISQVVYFLMRRHNRKLRHHLDDGSQSGSGGSNLSPRDMANPTFMYPEQGVVDHENNNLDDEEHIYDIAMGTVSGRHNPVYNTYIARDSAVMDGQVPEKDMTDGDSGVGGDKQHDYDYEFPPPPYDSNGGK